MLFITAKVYVRCCVDIVIAMVRAVMFIGFPDIYSNMFVLTSVSVCCRVYIIASVFNNVATVAVTWLEREHQIR